MTAIKTLLSEKACRQDARPMSELPASELGVRSEKVKPRNMRAALGLCFVSLSALIATGCVEREVILPGEREDIRAVLIDPEQRLDGETSAASSPDAGGLTEELSRSAPITLPPMTSNRAAPQNNGTSALRSEHPALSESLKLAWSADIGEGDQRRHRIVADPVIDGERIYTLDSHTRVTALNLSGQRLWTHDIVPDDGDLASGTGGGLAYDEGVIYVTTGFGAVTALDADTGQEIWQQELDASSSGAPLVSGDLVYLIAGDNLGWAINKNSGRIIWQLSAAETKTNVLGAAAPIIVDDLVVFAFGSGEVKAVFSQGGLRRWDANVIGGVPGRALSRFSDITSAPIEREGVIYVGNQSGRTVALDAQSGNRIWTASEGAIAQVLPIGGDVFLINARNALVRLDGRDGSRIWAKPLPNFVNDRPRKRAEVYAHRGPILAGGRIWLSSSDGYLRSFDPESGAQLSEVAVPGGASTSPVVAGQTLYVVTADGELRAYR